ncbi:hypothetical protein QOT17_003008 [Balamuthia mandrillaris]
MKRRPKKKREPPFDCTHVKCFAVNGLRYRGKDSRDINRHETAGQRTHPCRKKKGICNTCVEVPCQKKERMEEKSSDDDHEQEQQPSFECRHHICGREFSSTSARGEHEKKEHKCLPDQCTLCKSIAKKRAEKEEEQRCRKLLNKTIELVWIDRKGWLADLLTQRLEKMGIHLVSDKKGCSTFAQRVKKSRFNRREFLIVLEHAEEWLFLVILDRDRRCNFCIGSLSSSSKRFVRHSRRKRRGGKLCCCCVGMLQLITPNRGVERRRNSRSHLDRKTGSFFHHAFFHFLPEA